MENMGSSRRVARDSRIKLWRKRLRDFSGSRVTVDEFCGQLGVTTATFYYWRKKVVEAGGSSGVLTSSVIGSRKPGSVLGYGRVGHLDEEGRSRVHPFLHLYRSWRNP